MTDQRTKGLQQIGFCDSCGEPAFSKRHTTGMRLYQDEAGEWHGRNYPIEHKMCVRHKAYYIRAMDLQKRELEKKEAARHKAWRIKVGYDSPSK